MTSGTTGGELLLFHHSRVAGLAVEAGMRALQWEGRVLERGGTPDLVPVTALAGRTHPAEMAVVGLVAAAAGLRNRVVHVAAAVTVGAAQVRVAAEERETGLTVVIELLRAPLGRGVTAAAIGALAAFVRIIRCMTADAGLGNSLVAFAGMAGGTGGFRMFVGQRETGRGMVEVSLSPGPGLVTAAAIDSQGLAMGVILLVTAAAGGGCAAVGSVGVVTTDTGQ